MKITLEPTEKIVQLRPADGPLSARIWQGVDDQGAPVHAYVVRIAAADSQPLEVHARFAAALLECVPARPDVAAIPLRLII